MSPQNASNKVCAYFTQPVGKSKPLSLMTWRIQENDLSGSFLFCRHLLSAQRISGHFDGVSGRRDPEWGRTCGLNIAEEPTVAHSPQLVLEWCLTRKLLPSASQILQNSNPPPSQAQGVCGGGGAGTGGCKHLQGANTQRSQPLRSDLHSERRKANEDQQ